MILIKKEVYFCILLIISILTTPSVLSLNNPAAVYCEELGYRHKVVKAENGEEGLCIVEGNSFEEWDFFNGKVGQEYSYCAKKGYNIKIKENGGLSPEYAVCVPETEAVRAEISVFDEMGLSDKIKEDLKIDKEKAVIVTENRLAGLAQTPSSFDWRNNNGNWLSPVKNQGSCGSCWAFAAVGAVEAMYNINRNNPDLDPDLAEQYLVSCAFPGSCSGGDTVTALNYIKNNGIIDEGCSPYLAYNAQCTKCSDWTDRLWSISGADYGVWYTQFTNEGLKEWIIEKGPLPIAIHVNHGYGDTSGFYNGLYKCDDRYDNYLNHAVVLVGYEDTGNPATSYWIIKNSWGSTWNDNGYFKIAFNECSVTEYVHYVDTVHAPSTADPGDYGELEQRIAALEQQNLDERLSALEAWKAVVQSTIATIETQLEKLKQWLFFWDYQEENVCNVVNNECGQKPACYNDANCDDGNECTDDLCVNPGTLESYCKNDENNADCDNGIYCDGADKCSGGSCINAGPAVSCDDGIGCTEDRCDEADDECVSTPNNDLCNNDLFCDGVETCDAALDCQAGAAVNCDDGSACTEDSCNEAQDKCSNVFSYNLCECQTNADCAAGKVCSSNRCVDDFRPEPCTTPGAWKRCGQPGCYGVSICRNGFWSECSSKGLSCNNGLGTCSAAGQCV